MRIVVLCICLFLSSAFSGLLEFAWPQVRVTRSRSVDTTNAEKTAVFDLWAEYLGSRPDTIWRETVWSGTQRRFWMDFDLTAPFVYQPDADGFITTYKPTVMAIVREGRRYSIRTLFYAEGLNPPDDSRNPRAIVRVYAERENGEYGEWKLRNALGVVTEHWNRPAIGKITFVSEPSRGFDIELARRSVAFCDSISNVFPFFDWDPFDFYITRSREEVDGILGLEYYIDGFPWGRTMRQYDILVSGRGSEWYPQGLARMVATGPGLAPHPIVLEGFVGWISGRQERSFSASMREAAAFVSANEAFSFQDYLDRRRSQLVEGSPYFPGAILCEMVFDARGADGIEELFKAGRSDDDLYAVIESTLGIGRRELQTAWRQKVLEYL